MQKIINYTLAALCVIGLILVRRFEDVLFYDPFLNYFHLTGADRSYPTIDRIDLNVSLLFRYSLNAILTLCIVFFLFGKRKYVQFTALVLVIGFLVLLPIMNYLLVDFSKAHEMILFYVRRFIIQPMFLLVLVPCFFYQQIQQKKRPSTMA